MSEVEHWQLLEQQAQDKIIELEEEFGELIQYTVWLKKRYAERGEMIEKLSMRIYELTEPKKCSCKTKCHKQ